MVHYNQYNGKHCLYKLTNKTNQKGYVGYTSNLKQRMSAHRRNAREGKERAISAAIRKYGWDNFNIEILCCANSREEGLLLESNLIIQHNTFIGDGCGYNMTKGGEGSKPEGRIMTPEIRQKISERTREVMRADPWIHNRLVEHGTQFLVSHPEHHQKMFEAAKTQRESPEYEVTRAKISEASKANFTPEALDKMHEGGRQFWASDRSQNRRQELSSQMSQNRPLGDTSWNKGRAWTEEEKARQSQAHLGKIVTEETRSKIAESAHQFHVARREAGLPARRTGIVKLSEDAKTKIGQKAQRFSDDILLEVYRRKQAGESTKMLAVEFGMPYTMCSSVDSGGYPRMKRLL